MEKHVLVVEDDQFLRESLSLVLTTNGYKVSEACNGEEGLKVYLHQKPHFILSDIRMPVMDGVEFLKKVREKDSKIFFCLMTGFSEIMESKAAYEIGASEFMLKPFEGSDLIHMFSNADNKTIENLSSNYCTIAIDQFITGSKTPTDVFVRLSDQKYILIARKGTELDQDRVKNYKNKGLTEFHVKKEDFSYYVDINIKLSKAAAQSNLHKEKKVHLMKHTSEILLEDCMINGLSKEKFKESQQIVENVVNLISEDEDAADTLVSLAAHSKQTFSHSVAVSLVSCMIARALEWKSPSTMFRLSVGALMHDIGKKEISKKILDKKRSQRTFEETEIYESHPIRGKDILSSMPWVPSEVIQICLHHHESITGKGFPMGLRRNRIHPLALIVSLANTFCNRVLLNGNRDGELVDPMKCIQDLYELHSEEFDSSTLLGLMLVFEYPVPDDLIARLKSEKKSS